MDGNGCGLGLFILYFKRILTLTDDEYYCNDLDYRPLLRRAEQSLYLGFHWVRHGAHMLLCSGEFVLCPTVIYDNGYTLIRSAVHTPQLGSCT